MTHGGPVLSYTDQIYQLATHRIGRVEGLPIFNSSPGLKFLDDKAKHCLIVSLSLEWIYGGCPCGGDQIGVHRSSIS